MCDPESEGGCWGVLGGGVWGVGEKEKEKEKKEEKKKGKKEKTSDNRRR